MSLPTYTLQRIKQNSSATFGEMRDADGKRLCYTLERPWLNNAHGISCIPAGTYRVKRRWSPKHNRNVYGLLDVPDRSDIEIHPANLAIPELEGCISLGTQFGEVSTPHGDGYGIRNSKTAVAAFEKVVGVDEWDLVVNDPASEVA